MIDHSNKQPREAVQRFTVSAGGAYLAEEITPPGWAYAVTVLNPSAELRLATSGTDGELLDEDYLTLPVAAGLSAFPLKGREEVTVIRPFFLAGSGVDTVVELAYHARS